MKITQSIIFLLVFLVFSLQGFGQSAEREQIQKQIWVDSVFNSLSIEERIAQLMVVRANYPGDSYFKQIDKYIKKYNIGGVTFFKNNPHAQAVQTNKWQQMAKTPLFISIDAEWGLGMRLDSTISFPFQMTLGAIQNDELIYHMGASIARQCKRMGIHMNFAPVVDVNVNPANPVINVRSFGEDRELVTKKGLKYMEGLQDNGIIATAKHFPGHGDTDTDSHLTLPLINHDKQRLDSVELYPFQQLINKGLGGIMIAHLYIPAYEKGENMASTLSYSLVTELLREKMGFDGLIVTDALDMKGVTRYHKAGDIELKALKAGNDILLLPSDVPKAVRRISKAIEDGEIGEDIVNDRCRRVLAYKYDAGLNLPQEVELKNLTKDLNDPDDCFLRDILFSEAITVVKNEDNILPFKRLDTLKIACLTIGQEEANNFQKHIDRYTDIDHYYVGNEPTPWRIKHTLKQLKDYNLVIIGLQNTSIYPFKNFGITQESLTLIDSIANYHKVVMDVFASPYSLNLLPDNSNIKAIMLSYQDNEHVYALSAQHLFGGLPTAGKLPVSVTNLYAIQHGIPISKSRLAWLGPQIFGLNQSDMDSIDAIAMEGIDAKAYPGCQIIGIKDGIVFYNKCFGHHTYAKKRMVQPSDIYDLASITKIAASTMSVMRLHDIGMINIDERLSNYLPFLRHTNKKNIIIRDMLCHQSRLQAWIPYYIHTVDEGQVLDDIYSKKITEDKNIRVAEKLYISDYYKHFIFDSIANSPLRKTNDYKYSDLGFYLLSDAIENIANIPFHHYVYQNFYKPLGLSRTLFLPREYIDPKEIVPSEKDDYFRNQSLRGDVHDMGSAMVGGIAGHAGLFSNAEELAILMQMLLQKGEYGGIQYFEPQTVKQFTKTQFPLNDNRRGIGFDKPLLVYHEDGPTCKAASHNSFGHSGFTGTYAWADPDNNLVYIFLSNRTYPEMYNSKISKMDIRTRIHQKMYELFD